MRVLFITRKYPPSVGGMQRVSASLATALGKQADVSVIAWGRSQKGLPLFLLKALLQSLYTIPSKKVTTVLIGDGLIAPIGYLIKLITRKKTAIIIHGLDITYKNKLYQLLIPRVVARFDVVICISESTKGECLKRNIPEDKIQVITWGADLPVTGMDTQRLKIKDVDTKGKVVLTTVGRLVKRKGVEWFIRNVMPTLPNNYIYVVVGDGPEHPNILQAIAENNLAKRVWLLGKVSDEVKDAVYSKANIFIMPNIRVKGDIEGFGVVAVEAAVNGLPVVASNIDGIPDAVIPQKTGYLVESQNKQEFITAIKTMRLTRETVLKASSKFKWEVTAEKYAQALR